MTFEMVGTDLIGTEGLRLRLVRRFMALPPLCVGTDLIGTEGLRLHGAARCRSNWQTEVGTDLIGTEGLRRSRKNSHLRPLDSVGTDLIGTEGLRQLLAVGFVEEAFGEVGTGPLLAGWSWEPDRWSGIARQGPSLLSAVSVFTALPVTATLS